MSDDHGDKTELPTQLRRKQARERGQVARSTDVNSAAMILAIATAFHYFGKQLATSLADLLRESLSAPAWQQIEPQRLNEYFWSLAAVVAAGCLPLIGVLVLAGVCVNLSQVGFLLTTQPLAPDPERLSPLAGLQRMFSLSGILRLLASVLKIVVLAAIVAGFVSGQLGELLRTIDFDTATLCRQMGSLLVALSFQMALGLAAIAVVDYGCVRWKYEQDLKMTKEELREELRNSEGDPQLRRRRREAHRALASGG